MVERWGPFAALLCCVSTVTACSQLYLPLLRQGRALHAEVRCETLLWGATWGCRRLGKPLSPGESRPYPSPRGGRRPSVMPAALRRLSLLAARLLKHGGNSTWNYDEHGRDWPGVCANGTRQSPIAISLDSAPGGGLGVLGVRSSGN